MFISLAVQDSWPAEFKRKIKMDRSYFVKRPMHKGINLLPYMGRGSTSLIHSLRHVFKKIYKGNSILSFLHLLFDWHQESSGVVERH